MSRYRFIYNLKKETFTDHFKSSLKPSGYLLAPNNATPQFRKMAGLAREEDHCDLFADNGNYVTIGKARSLYEKESASLLRLIQRKEKQIGRNVLATDVPASLSKSYRNLLRKASSTVKKTLPSDEERLAAQLQYSPTHLIGVEDITMALMLGLNVEPEYLNQSRKYYQTINEDTAKRAVKQGSKLPPPLQSRYYPVASAVSYDTAFDAGVLFAKYRLKRISMGFGAYMSDDNYSDRLCIGGRTIKLPVKMPNRYLRTIAVARGFWDGYTGKAGFAPQAFHFLGLGAPIMIPLAVLCAWGTSEVSFDATSPIRDAVEGTFYSFSPAYVKSRAHDMAFRLASGETKQWPCKCPFCRSFTSRHRFDYTSGRRWLASGKRTSVEIKDLGPRGGLYKAYPLLCEPAGGAFRQEVSDARMGHNHWVIEQIFLNLNKNSKSLAAFRTYVQTIVDDYVKITNSKRFADSIAFAFDLATGKGFK